MSSAPAIERTVGVASAVGSKAELKRRWIQVVHGCLGCTGCSVALIANHC